MAKQIYYYYYENGICHVYDSHAYRGSSVAKGFYGVPYAAILDIYDKLTGKKMQHSTSKDMDDWRI